MCNFGIYIPSSSSGWWSDARGLHHENCAVDDIVVDEKLKLVTTPAYMLATNISEAAQGINKLVAKVLERV